jgi:cytoskeleton-associated protein 5
LVDWSHDTNWLRFYGRSILYLTTFFISNHGWATSTRGRFYRSPISERLAHKNWKARVNGYESLIKTFETTASDNDPAFGPYINNSELLKKIVTDANAVAQEKGVECIVALVKFAGETAAKTRDAVVPALVDKCLGSTRAGTRNQAVETILQYVEVENGGARGSWYVHF